MTTAQADGGSFRDPGGRIFDSGDRILRTVMPSSAAAYEAARDSGLYCRLIERGLLVASTETDGSSLPDLAEAPAYVLSHPRIPFVSYPYEWSFALHRRAALHHLDVQLAALADGFTLSDATAYNIQFIGSKPVFIDHLSFKPYRDGEVWIGHRQFCAQFLNPLIFWSRLGIPPNPWFRGSLEGIPDDVAANNKLLAVTDEFINLEKEGIKEYKSLLKVSEDYYHGLFKTLVGAMIRDSEKHVDMLQFLRERLKGQ